MFQVTLEDAATRPPELIQQVAAGEEVEIMSDAAQVARLVPPAPPLTRNPAQRGSHKGQVLYVAPDIDDLPEGFDIENSEGEAIKQRFARLAERWRNETAALSSVSQIAMNPAYQEIIGLGRAATPLILKELKRQPGHWFWALRAITGEDPVRPEQRGKVREMTAAWLHWGAESGVIA